MSHNIEDMLVTQFLYNWGQRSRLQLPQNGTYQSLLFLCINTKFDIVATKNVGDILGIYFKSSIEAKGQGHSDLKQYATFL